MLQHLQDYYFIISKAGLFYINSYLCIFYTQFCEFHFILDLCIYTSYCPLSKDTYSKLSVLRSWLLWLPLEKARLPAHWRYFYKYEIHRLRLSLKRPGVWELFLGVFTGSSSRSSSL